MSRVPPLIALGYGAYLLYAFWARTLYFYIHPVYIVPTVATGLVLLALAGMAMRATGTHEDHGHASPLRIAVLALALAVGFLLPPMPLSPLTAAQRGVELASLGSVQGRPQFDISVRPEAYTIKDWVKAFQADPEPGRHAGKPARVTGFVYREQGLPVDWFLVARFVVTCCAVDAQPVGLAVRAVDGPVPDQGRWVRVEGVWEVADVGGQRRGVIAAKRLTPTERPDQPYLY